MRSIPTDLLRTFVTIIDVRGYTRAGERLGRTQPSISSQIKRLQDLLGVQLFSRDIRKSGGVYLSEEGEIVANYARRMLAPERRNDAPDFPAGYAWKAARWAFPATTRTISCPSSWRA